MNSIPLFLLKKKVFLDQDLAELSRRFFFILNSIPKLLSLSFLSFSRSGSGKGYPYHGDISPIEFNPFVFYINKKLLD